MVDHTRSAPMTPLEEKLIRRIGLLGPMTVAEFMQAALLDTDHGYYRARQPFGAQGDFITAPELSPLFGEMIGLWVADLWARAGSLAPFRLIECGPGRGLLMQDALRAIAKTMPNCIAAMSIHLIEASAARRAEQKAAINHTELFWHEDIDQVPPGWSIILGNEFFDALPIHQYVAHQGRWHERGVGIDDDGRLAFRLNPAPAPMDQALAQEGAVLEVSPARLNVMRAWAIRLAAQGGAALVIDYGHDRVAAVGDTLQAVCGHGYADPLSAVGEADLTSHVDFHSLAEAAISQGLVAAPVVTQGGFLRMIGIDVRLAQIQSRLTPAKAELMRSAVERLTQPQGMGELFKCLCIWRPDGPLPAGFKI